jgi:hypothetical protein
MLSKLRESPSSFSELGARGSAAVVLALSLIAIPATALWLAELVAWALMPRRRRLIHGVLLSLLVAAISWRALVDAGMTPGFLRTALTVAALAVTALAYLRFEWARSFFGFLAFAAPVVVVLFLARSPTSHLFGEGGEAGPAFDPGPPIVLVVLDELPTATLLDRHGEVDGRLFPSIAALSRTSTWYRNARAVADQTVRAVPAILTGTPGPADEVPTAADHAVNLFTVLAGGYAIEASETVTDLCPREICGARSSLAQQVADLASVAAVNSDPLPGNLAQRLTAPFARERADVFDPGPQVKGFLSRIDAAHPHTAYVIHALVPHVPWDYLPDGQRYPDPGLPGQQFAVWGPERSYVEAGYERHVLQTMYADRLLGRIIARLRAERLFDRALVIVTADHGVDFTPGFPTRPLTKANAGAILPVPLFIKWPGQRRARRDRQTVRTTDVLPTIAVAAGARIPSGIEGRPLQRPLQRPASDIYYPFGAPPLRLAEPLVRHEMSAVSVRRNRLFGGGSPYAVGGAGWAIGKRAAALGGRVRRLSATLDGAAALAGVDPGAPVLPAYLSGSVNGYAGPPHATVLLALNGRVVASARVFGEGGATRFIFLAPPAGFVAGSNDAAVYLARRGHSPQNG